MQFKNIKKEFKAEILPQNNKILLIYMVRKKVSLLYEFYLL